ncbi:ATP-dependent 6-phosphofructokinase, muscle type-like isoform X2 [Symsagittifera roscoffensis]|uniref:ATP-dependent 6-phosphofructokinase, muscle type-like isoform X2 n=1 Tax=Symsagittifera roscoffensis TaxID=84072 RepID=UPI00307B5313
MTRESAVFEDEMPSSPFVKTPTMRSRAYSVSAKRLQANIGVLTSGGDAPGMNAAVRAAVVMGISLGAKVYLIREGYQGMVEGEGFIEEASWSKVSDCMHVGGTFIGTARCKEFREKPGRLRAARNLINKGITNLVVIGGDGSLTGANLFREEWPTLVEELHEKGEITSVQKEYNSHLQIVGLVGSIDNDFCGTDMTIGADTALHRILECADALKTTALSHQRTFVLEVMGRHCGYLALVAGIATAADWIFIPEDPPEDGWEEAMCEKLNQAKHMGQRLCIVVVAEGATDRHGKPISVNDVKKVITDRTNHDTRVTILGHVQRGGSPSAFDRILGTRMGAEAIAALRDSTPDTPAYVISISGNREKRVPLMEAVLKTQSVAKAVDEFRYADAIALRGKSFQNNLEIYRTLNNRSIPERATSVTDRKLSTEEQLFSKFAPGQERTQAVAIMNMGNPAPGMNAAVRAVVRTLFYEDNFKVLLVSEGFDGLMIDDVEYATWNSVSGYLGTGGSILGTNRRLPNDLKKVSVKFDELNICGLVVIGGFQAFEAVNLLTEAREDFRQFCIPMIVVPATISNSVPGCELSIGCDTALNAICRACDVIKQSAQGTRKRVFIIETFGGYCGYLATMAAMACDADDAYIHEEKFTIEDLKDDVYHIKEKIRCSDIQRGLLVRNENANENYTMEFMERMLNEEGKGAFSCRSSRLGHMQEGHHPTVYDRNYASKMGVRAGQWMVRQINDCTSVDQSTVLTITPETSVVLGMVYGKLEFIPIEKVAQDADLKLTRPKTQWWMRLRLLIRALAKHHCFELTDS